MIPFDEDVVRKAIEASSLDTAIYVGCDSRRFRAHGRWFAAYTTVVVMHIDQSSGCIIYGKRNLLADFGNVKQRMLSEVNYAVDVATSIVDAVGDRRFEIHLDVNPDPKHKSSLAVKEALGYVQGMGFIGRIKPDAPIASTAADFFGKARVNVPKEFLLN